MDADPVYQTSPLDPPRVLRLTGIGSAIPLTPTGVLLLSSEGSPWDPGIFLKEFSKLSVFMYNFLLFILVWCDQWLFGKPL